MELRRKTTTLQRAVKENSRKSLLIGSGRNRSRGEKSHQTTTKISHTSSKLNISTDIPNQPTTSSQEDSWSNLRRRGRVKCFDSTRMSYGFIIMYGWRGNKVVFFHVNNVHSMEKTPHSKQVPRLLSSIAFSEKSGSRYIIQPRRYFFRNIIFLLNA